MINSDHKNIIEMISHDLVTMGISHENFAGKIGLTLCQIKSLLNEKGGIETSLAEKIANLLGNTAVFSLWLQSTCNRLPRGRRSVEELLNDIDPEEIKGMNKQVQDSLNENPGGKAIL